MSQFDHLFGEKEPTNKELVSFLVHANELMFDNDEKEMSRILLLPNPKTNKLMMVAILRGLFAYRRHNSLPAWDEALVNIQAYLLNQGENPRKVLTGLIEFAEGKWK